jgi:hypothetical protein
MDLPSQNSEDKTLQLQKAEVIYILSKNGIKIFG